MPFYFLVACTMGVFCDGLDHFLWFIPLFSLFFFSYKKCELQKWQMTVLFLVSLMCVFFYVLYFDVL